MQPSSASAKPSESPRAATATAAAKPAATSPPANPHALAESFNQELIQAHREALNILRHLMAEAEATAIIEEEHDPARHSSESRARVNGRNMPAR